MRASTGCGRLPNVTVELASSATGWRTWRYCCDLCERTLWTALDHRDPADSMARTNGWIVTDTTLCPACAIVAETNTERQTKAERQRRDIG